MSERWKLGSYEFVINPNRYGEQIQIVGDSVKTLNGTLITQPTSTNTTYQMSSVFFQHRPRVVSESAISKADGIEFVNNKFYVLDSTLAKVNVYSSNLSTLQKSISIIASPNGENITAFDVQSDETVWAVETVQPDAIIHKVVGTTRTLKNMTDFFGDIVGIKYHNNYLWIVTNSSIIYQVNQTDMSIINSTRLPSISYSSYGYQGMTVAGDYLVVAYGDNETAGVYYIDPTNGNLCNNFYLPDYYDFKDVAYNGKHFIFLVNEKNTIKYVTGNTVLLDLYELEKQIKNNGYLEMVDDMGVPNRVAVTNYDISRKNTSLLMFDVSISAMKVNRGVN